MWSFKCEKLTMAAALLAACVASSCASMDYKRRTPTSGTFEASALSLTILSFDIPGHALNIARGNVSDAGRPNSVVENEFVFPYLGNFDWLLDFVSIRYARVSGTWGFDPDDPEAER